jgi:hypothetical protein
MLKIFSNVVLGRYKASTYRQEYVSAFRDLRPSWRTILSILLT